MNMSLEEIRRLLQEQLVPLDAKVAELETELRAVYVDRDKLNKSIAALNDGPKANASRDEAADRISKMVLVSVYEGFLADNGSLMATDLDGLAQSKLKEMGYKITGYAACARAALKCPQFSVDAQNRVSLTRKKQDQSVA